MTRKRLLAKLLYTASCWHGSTGKGPLAMLQLASMRKVLSEEHRKTLIDEIMDDIRVSMAWAHDGRAVESNLEEIRELTLLWEEVASCEIGAEWLTDRENLRYGDELYEKGVAEEERGLSPRTREDRKVDMSTITTSEKAEFEKIASMSGWEIADHFGCSYSGDANPINHGGFFYDARDWAKYGYARAVEFWWDDEHKRLVVQRGTIPKPDTPEKWESVWGCVGAYEGEQRENIHAQIDASKAGMGMEPDGTRYPDLMEYPLQRWKEWHIWRSVARWLRELGE